MRKNKLDITARDEEEVVSNDERDLNSGMPTSASLPSAIESSNESGEESNHSDNVHGTVALGNSVVQDINLDVVPVETDNKSHEINKGLSYSFFHLHPFWSLLFIDNFISHLNN